MKRNLTALIIGALFGACTGCTSLGLVPAQSLDEKIAYAEGIVASARQSAAQALNAGSMPVATAQRVETLAEQADSAIVLARAAESTGDTSTAAGKLAAAQSILTELQTLTKGQ